MTKDEGQMTNRSVPLRLADTSPLRKPCAVMPRPVPGGLLPRVRDRIRRAALLRANGASWPAVAAELGVKEATARGWPAKHPDVWRAAARAANRQVLAEATAEAVLTLRRQLRSEDDKASRDAATKLVQFAGRAARVRPKAAGKAAAANGSAGVAAFLDGLNDAELDAVIAEVLRGYDPAHDGGTRRLDAGRPAGAD